MTHIEQAIKEAMKGGWKPPVVNWGDGINVGGKTAWFDVAGIGNQQGVWLSEIFLDPLFWQAYGKAKGWDDDTDTNVAMMQTMEGSRWIAKWHRFIDHLAEGKDAESFFATL